MLTLVGLLLLGACDSEDPLPPRTGVLASPTASPSAIMPTSPTSTRSTDLGTPEATVLSTAASSTATTTIVSTFAPTRAPSSIASVRVQGLASATSRGIGTNTPIAQGTNTTLHSGAMRTGFEGDMASHFQMPNYSMRIHIDPLNRVLTGTEQIDFTNSTGATLDTIVLRLYPNFPKDDLGKGGNTHIQVQSITVDGHPLEVTYAAKNTAVLITLPQPLEPEAKTLLNVSYKATMVSWGDGSWPLQSYYPMLAVYQNGWWRMDVTTFADRVFAESAVYDAEITVPMAFKLVTTGSTVGSHLNDGGTRTYSVQTGPVREFAMTVGKFEVEQVTAGVNNDVTLNVFTAAGSSLDAREVANIAAGALTAYDKRFGKYPYSELDIHLLAGEYDGGDEFPGLIFLYSKAQVNDLVRFLTAHEVAHQWWYGVVGNDIYNEPWLDEAFAQYSGYIYAQDMLGSAPALQTWQRQVMRHYNLAKGEGDMPVGLSISSYGGFWVYYHAVYGKGAFFLHELRRTLGDEVFFSAVRTYESRYRYGIGSTEAVKQVLEEVSGKDLSALFEKWVIK